MASRLVRETPSPQRIVDAFLGEPDRSSPSGGVLRWLGWTAARRYLKPVLQAYGTWRIEDRWQRRHCPTCGALPAMGQLIGVDPGFMRFLSCGCCETRWRWRRTACPFCENDAHRLEVVKIESEPELRLDHCESCKGYLKTYVGRGDESVILADWTSLHLDVLARDRGLERKAHSLYDLGALIDAST
jgi:FdhE protein